LPVLILAGIAKISVSSGKIRLVDPDLFAPLPLVPSIGIGNRLLGRNLFFRDFIRLRLVFLYAVCRSTPLPPRIKS
jgi:hypothetical protein